MKEFEGTKDDELLSELEDLVLTMQSDASGHIAEQYSRTVQEILRRMKGATDNG